MTFAQFPCTASLLRKTGTIDCLETFARDIHNENKGFYQSYKVMCSLFAFRNPEAMEPPEQTRVEESPVSIE